MYIPVRIKNLPKPVSVYKVGSAVLEVYRAKSAGISSWTSPTLLKLVARARESFYQYTEHPPLFDEYDNKSAVYLTKATYPVSAGLVEEWISVRFVPGGGIPRGFQDLVMYEYNGKRIEHFVQGKLLSQKGRAFWQYLVSISKLCGIRPYFRDAKKRGKIDLPRKLSYTGISLALMSRQFFQDARVWGIEPTYITIQIPSDLIEKSLTITVEGISPLPRFIPASVALSLRGSERIHLVRNTYTYQYPIYFFNFPSIVKMLQKLYREGRISEATIKYYLGKDVSLEKISNLPLYTGMFSLRRLGKMFMKKGRLKAGTITGEELRKMADKLKDGPTLYIMSLNDWKKDIERLCGKLRSQN